jgi:hypothetical protein
MTPTEYDLLAVLRGAPTPLEEQQIREVDALIQYQDGKYASTPRIRIAPQIVRQALAAYDPALPLRINAWCAPTKPPCPHCHSVRVRFTGYSGVEKELRKYHCHECWRSFTVRREIC